jgi:hypothetical protein
VKPKNLKLMADALPRQYERRYAVTIAEVTPGSARSRKDDGGAKICRTTSSSR